MIDIHTHLHPDRLGQAIRRWFAENSPWKLYHPCEPTAVASALRKHAVERFVYCSYAHKPGIAQNINEWLIQTAKQLDGYGLPLFTVHLDDPDYIYNAEYALAGGCIGMKIHEDVQMLAIDDKRFDPVYQLVTDADGFVLAHIGPIPWRIIPETGVMRVKRVKEKHPALKLIVAHMGAPDTNLYFELLDQIPGLYLDTTMAFSNVEGLETHPEIALLERHAGKILFGSDYPNIPYDYDVEPRKIRECGISSAASNLILKENALSILAPFV